MMLRSTMLALAFTLPSHASTTTRPRGAAPSTGPACIDANRIVGRTATAQDMLAVDLAGGRRVAIELVDACPHLTDIDSTYTIVFDQRDGPRLCRGSRFQIVDPLVARSGGTASFSYCRIRGFIDLPPARR